MALAMGLQLAIARLGTAAALLLSPVLVAESATGAYPLNVTNKPAFLGLMLLLLGAIVWAVFVAMDAKFDKEQGTSDKVVTAESPRLYPRMRPCMRTRKSR